MLANTFVSILALAGLAVAEGVNTPSCSAEQRLKSAQQVIVAYAANPLATYGEFDKIPFGVPNKAGGCVTTIAANGLCPVPVATTGAGVVQFGTETRQAFSSVTGKYTDFPQNLTAVINTNVTLGVNSLIPLPITFNADVYLDFNVNCRIYQVRAVAWVPSDILGILFQRLNIPVPSAVCSNLPVKREFGQAAEKRQAIEFTA
ncbi:hypothetical protein VHEMI09896 [[Torrubiella] hemipterigena]|uniref:Uncharacterized protein n=1 Tax=[Torrubiella] hemipterigena TaxID=1531966 RepID=A0A0A1THF1_9HYPO|nr:hypothetical protein VHEMI09896 [[Torrubiella] hemipterigena]